ncbi:MAG: ComF family protein [Candidatus Doudnabacteria bacterium]|nr:ComF family protein [Candidatus Doudnabacteria bacterium]
MNIGLQLKKVGQGFLDLLFPISCIVCNKDGKYLCDDCKHKLPRLERQQCLVCQQPSPYGKTHPECVTRNSVDGALAALTHKDKLVHKIIQVFKYNFISDLANPLSELIADTIDKQGLKDYFQDFVIVPVPLHHRRFNWRGFNQASLLAKSMGQLLGIRVDDSLVTRQKFTQPQVKLNADQRKKNLEGAFSIIGTAANKKILLVDDVVTSGSTANELTKLLKKSHATEVWIITAAHG